MGNSVNVLTKIFASLFICLGIIGGAYFLGKGIRHVGKGIENVGTGLENKGRSKGSIVVKGSVKEQFTSDLIVLEGYYPVENDTSLELAFKESSRQKELLKEFLIGLGINRSEIVFPAADYSELERQLYNDTGKWIGSEPYFRIRQEFEIRSNQVDSVENASREISDILTAGIRINLYSPRYYYTKLADLKHELIKNATNDARIRAEIIAENSGGHLGKLENARMGVMQITGQNSNEDYSWGGSFNTADKEKEASITINLTYLTETD